MRAREQSQGRVLDITGVSSPLTAYHFSCRRFVHIQCFALSRFEAAVDFKASTRPGPPLDIIVCGNGRSIKDANEPSALSPSNFNSREIHSLFLRKQHEPALHIPYQLGRRLKKLQNAPVLDRGNLAPHRVPCRPTHC